MMRAIVLGIVLVLGWVQNAFSQVETSIIEAYIEKARIEWNVPGMAVAIVKDGKIVSNRGYGFLKEGEKSPVDKNTLFAIASNTKAFVSSSLGILEGEGKLKLDDKVQKYIPEFELYDSYASSEATIEDLLCHRLGLGTYSGDVIWYKTDFSASEVIGRIKYVPQQYSFRGGYGYSNLMFITAGEVIHKVTGKPWDVFVKERFFIPLGMNRTITSTNDLKAFGNFAIPHKPSGEDNIPIDWVNWDNMGAAGGIISSSDDMGKWLIFQLNNGIWENDTILDPAIQNVLWTPHNNHTVSLQAQKNNPGTNFSAYGLGWGISDYYGYRMVTHGGGYDGMYSQVAMIPELKLGIVILTNTMKSIATPLRYYIINSFIQKDLIDFSKEALEKASKKNSMHLNNETQKAARTLNTNFSLFINEYIGTYFSDMLGEIHITENNGILALQFVHAPDLSATLDHWHYDTWELKWDKLHAWFDFGTIQFHFDTNMKITSISFDVPNDDIFFDELKVVKIN